MNKYKKIPKIQDDIIFVSIVVPIRNEEKHIESCIESLFLQTYPKENMEFIFVDGISEDRTKEIIEKLKKQSPIEFILLDNPQKTVPYAMNIGVRNARGKYIVRLDAHSEYAEDYIEKCVYYLEHTDAVNVGGPMIAKGKTFLQNIIAAAYSSRVALGGGKFHNAMYEGYADTVYLGAFEKKALVEVGLYDEKFTRNQDDELNFRLLEAGKKIYVTPRIRSIYYPRNTYRKLWDQYYQYGWWKVEILRKHRKLARITHFIPALFVLFLCVGFILSLINETIKEGFWAILLIYILLLGYSAYKNKYLRNYKEKLRLIGVIFLLHCSYGFGFIVNCLSANKNDD